MEKLNLNAMEQIQGGTTTAVVVVCWWYPPLPGGLPRPERPDDYYQQ